MQAADPNTQNPSQTPSTIPTVQKGSVLIYRVFDIAEEVDLAAVETLLRTESSKRRLRISRGPGGGRNAVVMRNAPVRLNLEDKNIRIGRMEARASLSATVWDYGVLSIVFEVPIPAGTAWSELVTWSALLNGDDPSVDELDEVAWKQAAELSAFIRPALRKTNEWKVFEDYVLFFLQEISPSGGTDVSDPGSWVTQRIPELILGETVQKPGDRLGRKSRQGILESTFQYQENDLVSIDWNSAVVVEPSGSRDIPDVIEFALTHLLEFRYYDDLLDRRLAELYDSLETRQRGIWRSGYARALNEANARFLEISEFIERVDNSLKVVGDFYVAVIFRGAIRRFRIHDWQQSITRKLNLLARVSELLQGEVNVQRAHTLELIIIVLIAFEILTALFRG